jgi:hypothetical protein
MSDDLVRRLRQDARFAESDYLYWLNGAESINEAADRIEELEAKLEMAVGALAGVDKFVRDLSPFADPSHTLAPPLAKACEVYAELTGEPK